MKKNNNNFKKLNAVGPCLNSTDNIGNTTKYEFIKGEKSYNKEDITVINLHVPHNIKTDPSHTHTARRITQSFLYPVTYLDRHLHINAHARTHTHVGMCA